MGLSRSKSLSEKWVLPALRANWILVLMWPLRVGHSLAGTRAWVQGSDWNQFARDLTELEQTRKGEAIISAMSPHELRLRIFAADLTNVEPTN